MEVKGSVNDSSKGTPEIWAWLLFQRDVLHSVLWSICKAIIAPLGSVLVLNGLQLLVTQPQPQCLHRGMLETATLQNRLDFLSRGSVQTPSVRLGSRCDRNCICLLFFSGLGWASISLLASNAFLTNCTDRRGCECERVKTVYTMYTQI